MALGGGWQGEELFKQCPFFSTFRTTIIRVSVQRQGPSIGMFTHALKDHCEIKLLTQKIKATLVLFKIKLKFIEMWQTLKGKGDAILKTTKAKRCLNTHNLKSG